VADDNDQDNDKLISFIFAGF